ncbi:hypothetical protein EIP91_010859 [Steccherinum ochraceum]|uniref:Uncharacterized protein n=1 Tax=Steccherinum ochraceum TaxID=92696 RepID=A0A4R0R8N4_9APHY|nr:hypothetical protein EIP91_010859 [Steccherinum ochraceum]
MLLRAQRADTFALKSPAVYEVYDEIPPPMYLNWVYAYHRRLRNNTPIIFVSAFRRLTAISGCQCPFGPSSSPSIRKHAQTPSPPHTFYGQQGQYWTDRYSYLRSKGYVLRSKFDHQRTVLWKGKPLNAGRVHYLDFRSHYGDIQTLQRTVDAYCSQTQQLVHIRRIPSDSDELTTLMRISGLPRSPCPPVLDSFEDYEHGTTFVVMPYCKIDIDENTLLLLLPDISHMIWDIMFFEKHDAGDILARWPYMTFMGMYGGAYSFTSQPIWSLRFPEAHEECKTAKFGQDGVDGNLHALGLAITSKLASVRPDVRSQPTVAKLGHLGDTLAGCGPYASTTQIFDYIAGILVSIDVRAPDGIDV